MCVERAVGGVSGGQGVEVDFGLSAGFDYDGAGRIGGYAFAVSEGVSMVLGEGVTGEGTERTGRLRCEQRA